MAFSVLLKDSTPDTHIFVLTNYGRSSVYDQRLVVIIVGAEFETIILLIGRALIEFNMRRKFFAGNFVVTLPEDLVRVEV
jgi:hypothetical protein